MKIIFYTVALGDQLLFFNGNIPDIPTKEYDCYFLSDKKQYRKIVESKNWKFILINPEKFIKENNIIIEHLDFYNKYERRYSMKSTMYGKLYKFLSHKLFFLNDYDYLIYLDSKLKTINMDSIYQVIHTKMNNSNTIMVFRNMNSIGMKNIFDLETAANAQFRYQKQAKLAKEFINNKLNEGYKSQNINSVCPAGGFIIRKNSKNIKIINEKLVSQLLNDQYNLFFLVQDFKDSILVIDDKDFNSWTVNFIFPKT